MKNPDRIDVLNLSKTYNVKNRLLPTKKHQNVQALNEVSFSLTPGFYGLLGPNGAGKSTLINIVVAAIRQTHGVVLWNGESIQKLGIHFRRILGYMPQQQTLYDSYTGRRFLFYIAALKEIPKSETEIQVIKAASTVNLAEELDKRLSAYSGGMKQRLLAAAAMMNAPRLLIMDEPMAGLDPKERVHLRNVLSELSKNCIVIIATHVVPDVEIAADEILILKRGRLYDKDSTQNLVSKYAPGGNLESVYLAIFGGEENYETHPF